LKRPCEKALSYSITPSFRSIRTILKTSSDRLKSESLTMSSENSAAFAFTHGADYYGGENYGE